MRRVLHPLRRPTRPVTPALLIALLTAAGALPARAAPESPTTESPATQAPATEAIAPAATTKPDPPPPEDELSDQRFVRWTLQIEAPDTLRTLLERFLDLARYAQLAESERITRSELSRLIAATPAQVSELLETEGYFSARTEIVQTPLTPAHQAGETQQFAVRVSVTPGPRTEVEQVELQIAGPLQERAAAGDAAAQALIRQLRDDWELPVGSAFTQSRWSGAKTHALTQLRAEGYATPGTQRTEARVRADTARASLQLTLDSGPLYRIGSIHYDGLDHVETDAMQALLTFQPGAPLREQPFIDYHDRLVRTSLFDTIAVTSQPDPAHPDATPVTVRVGERRAQQVTLGVGVSDSTGPRVTVEHLHQAPFGLAWQAKSKIQLGQSARSVSLDLTSHPHPGPYRNLIGASLGRSVASGLEVTEEKLRLGRTQDTERIERLYYVEWQRALTRPSEGGPISDDSSSVMVNYQWVWRDLDSPILPTRGYSASAETGVGHSFHAIDDSGWFTRGGLRLTGYWPVGRSWYGQARLQAAEVFAGQTVSVPYTLLFRAGGDDSVRGYGYQTLGPSDSTGTAIGGRVLATASIELARPIKASLPALWWATFVDAGNAALDWGHLKPALGYGIGLRWRSPVGPLRIDLAYGQDVRRVRLHFTVGITF